MLLLLLPLLLPLLLLLLLLLLLSVTVLLPSVVLLTLLLLFLLRLVPAVAVAVDAAVLLRYPPDRKGVEKTTVRWKDTVTLGTPDASRRTADLYALDAVLWGTVSEEVRDTPAEIYDYFVSTGYYRDPLLAFFFFFF